MTDRELRDEIERLSVELRNAREQLDLSASVSAGAERLRTLTSRGSAAGLQREGLLEQIKSTQSVLAAQERELEHLADELSGARKRIAQLDPLPSPFKESPPAGYTHPRVGCAVLVALGLGALGFSSAAWWLA